MGGIVSRAGNSFSLPFLALDLIETSAIFPWLARSFVSATGRNQAQLNTPLPRKFIQLRIHLTRIGQGV